jgi:hypothetical protein
MVASIVGLVVLVLRKLLFKVPARTPGAGPQVRPHIRGGCPICLSDQPENLVVANCGHGTCGGCFAQYYQRYVWPAAYPRLTMASTFLVAALCSMGNSVSQAATRQG